MTLLISKSGPDFFPLKYSRQTLLPHLFQAGGKHAVLLNSWIIIDEVSLFCGGRIRRRALFVKAILSQPHY
jgi:hypothetical protein